MDHSASAKQYTYRRRQPEETVLYKKLAANVETFIADREAEGRPVPERVAKEHRDYLKCGILQNGFIRVVCPNGDYETAVAYSCKNRGFSCLPSWRGREAVSASAGQKPWNTS